MDTEDQRAFIAVQKGDINAFADIVRKYTAEVSQFISSKTKDEDLVDDVVQTAFIKLYKAISKLNPAWPIKPYLFQIAKNELYEEWSKRKKYTRLDETVNTSTAQSESSIHLDEAKHVLHTLKTDQKNALLWLSEGYTYEEIARKMGKPVNTVRTLIRRTRLFINHKLKL